MPRAALGTMRRNHDNSHGEFVFIVPFCFSSQRLASVARTLGKSRRVLLGVGLLVVESVAGGIHGLLGLVLLGLCVSILSMQQGLSPIAPINHVPL